MKKICPFSLFLVIVFCMFSCEQKTKVRTTLELSKIFNEQELKDIELIVSFAEKNLLEYTNTEDIDKAFQQFIQDNLENHFNKFDLFDYKDIEQLYENIDQDTFENIWTYNTDYNHILKDSTKTINIAFEKKYINYLELLGTKNPKIKGLVDTFKSIGDYSASFMYPPLLTQYNHEKKTLEAPKKFGDYNTRVYRSIDLITIFDMIYHARIEKKLMNDFRRKTSKK